mgnify:FL=1
MIMNSIIRPIIEAALDKAGFSHKRILPIFPAGDEQGIVINMSRGKPIIVEMYTVDSGEPYGEIEQFG